MKNKLTDMTKIDCAWYRPMKCGRLKRRYCDFEKCNWYDPINNNDLPINSNNSSINSDDIQARAEGEKKWVKIF